jgi:hypothetical protein
MLLTPEPSCLDVRAKPSHNTGVTFQYHLSLSESRYKPLYYNANARPSKRRALSFF